MVQEDEPLYAALRDAVSLGVVVVVSAGNCGEGCPSNACGLFRGVTSPGDQKEVITVGATNDAGNVMCFSSSQQFADYSKPEVYAPGADVYSALPGNRYGVRSGTSMAAPHVVGVAALLLEQNESLSPEEIKMMLSHENLQKSVSESN